MEEAIARYGAPDVFNTNRGVQFTSQAFTDALKAHSVRISMDGKGRLVRQRVRGTSLAQPQAGTQADLF